MNAQAVRTLRMAVSITCNQHNYDEADDNVLDADLVHELHVTALWEAPRLHLHQQHQQNQHSRTHHLCVQHQWMPCGAG